MIDPESERQLAKCYRHMGRRKVSIKLVVFSKHRVLGGCLAIKSGLCVSVMSEENVASIEESVVEPGCTVGGGHKPGPFRPDGLMLPTGGI